MTSPDPVVLQDDILVHVENDPDRRSTDPIPQLSRQLDAICTEAVSAHQIAALLEVEGLGDRATKDVYGHANVFSLATELYELVPMRQSRSEPAIPTISATPAEATPSALIMRGPIYLLPAVFFVALGAVISGERMLWVGLLSLLLAWAWNQGFGAIAYRLIGRDDIPGARLVSRVSLVAGTILVSVIATMLVPGGLDDVSTGIFAAGQAAYLIAAATLLMFGWDKLLVATLLPGLIIAIVSIAVPSFPDQLVLAATIGTMLAVVLTTIVMTRNGTVAGISSLSRFDISTAGFQALLGGTWAMLIGLAGMSMLGSSNVLTIVGLSAVPMVLTMGIAEWQLLRFRQQVRILLADTGDPESFSRSSRSAFANSMAVFSVALLATTAVFLIGLFLLGLLTESGFVLAFAFIGLGIAFFAGLTLVSLGEIVRTLAASVVIAMVIGSLFAVSSLQTVASAGIYAAGCFALCLLLLVGVFRLIPQVVVHR
jgi:hypothetical protein